MVKAEKVNYIKDMRSFSFIGDPGCDGLGAEIMTIFNLALGRATGNAVLIGGDIVPNGTKHFYENVMEMIDNSVRKPVFMLRGNHDADDYAYETFFGEKDY